MTENYKYFAHKECEFYPCHPAADGEFFNCLFCYCPLYALKDSCGGNVRYTKEGIKDCSACILPHSREGYDYIMKKFPELAELTGKK